MIQFIQCKDETKVNSNECRSLIDLVQESEPFVAFVGAGASSIAPSKLPIWKEFNTRLLECLCERLADYSRDRQPTAEMLSTFKARRDKTRFFAPDFQAQLMEEEVGPDYFRVWQSLDSDVYGPVHAGLAELAAKGRLAAIITTNFDRLIETALKEISQPLMIFHDQTTFEALERIVENEQFSALPVIKLHGTIQHLESLVDTLRQRVLGRPQPLEKVLQVLLRKYRWLYLGFSGADFSYNPNYLGILDAAPVAKGFVFFERAGKEVKEGVKDLCAAYGADKAAIVYGDLKTCFSDTFKPATQGFASTADQVRDEVDPRVKDRIRKWTEGLGYMAVVNILYSMLKSSGMEADALWLLRKTWKSYRSPDDTRSKSYDRYNYNSGMALLEVGFIKNPIALAEDMSNLLEWKEHADENAYEYFGRSYNSGKLLAAGGQLACILALRGEVGRAITLMSKVTDEALARDAKLELCDIAIASALLWDILQAFGPAVQSFHQCLQIAKELGDEPRRAMLCANLGRFLTYAGAFEKADEFIGEACRIGRRLDLRSVQLEVQSAKGLWLAESGRSAEKAVQILQQVVDAIHTLDDMPLFTKIDLLQSESAPKVIKGRHPVLCRVLLDLNRAALFAGNSEAVNRTLDELDELTVEWFPGYCPHYYLAYAQCLLVQGDPNHRELTADLIRRARLLGETSENPWVAQAADRIGG